MSGIHEERRDDLAAYSLGALPPDEARELEDHLRTCDGCASHVQWLQRAVDLMPASAPQLKPPKSLKKGLMAEVRADAKRERGGARKSSFGLFGVLMRPAIAIASVVVLVAGAVVGYELRSGDDTTTIAATAVGPATNTTASAMLERAGSKGTLHVEQLPALGGSSVYQTWLQVDGKMEPSTPFVVRRDGTNEVAIDGDLNRADAVLVTREPRGGSQSPTTAPILEADLK